MRSATRAHRVAADVRWRAVAQLVLVLAVVICAHAEDVTTAGSTIADTSSVATTQPIPAETTKPSIALAENATSAPPPTEKSGSENNPQTTTPPESTRATTPGESKADTVRSQPTVQSVSEAPKTSSSPESSTQKDAEESVTEVASELALESVNLAVVIKSPLGRNNTVKALVKNVTDGQFDDDEDDEASGYEYDADDDSDEHGPEYEGEDDDQTTSPRTSLSTEALSDEGLEPNKEATTEPPSSTTPAPRRPRHSDAAELEFPKAALAATPTPAPTTTPTPTATPRQRRPSRAKDERRVSLRDPRVAPGATLKKRRAPKERAARSTTTAPPLPPLPEPRPNYYQVDTSTDRPDATEQPVTPRRSKRRKKKARRQKQPKPTFPQERQLTAETRAAAELAAAAAAAESLQSELTPAPTATTIARVIARSTAPAKTPETDPTVPVSRSVRQDDVSIQQSDVNPDGSYSFSYDIADEGRHSRTEVATPDNVVSGRYGYVDANRQATYTQYSAGPRGFRAVGPDIARRMDLSQVGSGAAPRPPPDGRYSPEYDTYSDPNEDPSYSFQYSTDTANRREEADSRGDVRGEYKFVDDQGETHVVSYEAGAEKGFLVKSAHPDNGIPSAGFFPGRGEVPPRGRASIVRYRNGAYRFTAVGPDSRREECSSAANYRRGSYVYLDDKNVRRTVYYEAGPNIGFRVLANPAAASYRCPPWQGYAGEGTNGYGAPSPGGTSPPWIGGTSKPVSGSNRPWTKPPGGTTPAPWDGGPSITSGEDDHELPLDIADQDETGFPTLPPLKPNLPPRRPLPTKPPVGPSSRPSSGSSRPPGGSPRPPSGSPRPPSGGSPKPPKNPIDPQPTTYKPPSSSLPPWTTLVHQIPTFPPPAKRPIKTSSSSGPRPNTSFDKVFGLPGASYPGTPLNNRGMEESSDGGNVPPTENGDFPQAATPTTGRPPIQSDQDLPILPPLPPYRPFPSTPDPDGYRPYHSCCGGRLHVLPYDRYGRPHAVRTYVQSIDLSEEDRGEPGRAENPSVALERHVREHERKTSRRQRRRRRRRRRSVV